MSKWLARLISGGIIGIAIGFMMALAFSVGYGADVFMPSSPALVTEFSTNVRAKVASDGVWG